MLEDNFSDSRPKTWQLRTLIIDNYDSFTWNLVQMLEGLGDDPIVLRPNDTRLTELPGATPRRLIISPGPGTPEMATGALAAINTMLGKIPILGVCLGHQCLASSFGQPLKKLNHPIHGQTSQITHDGRGLFEGVPNPFTAMRYHSLVVAGDRTRKPLRETAWCHHEDENLVMALQHEEFPVASVQFHPESFLTPQGTRIMENFLSWT